MMKQWIFVLAVLLSGTGAAAQGILEVENKVLELASLKADDQPRTEVFAVKNTGDRPVIITRVSPMSYLLEAEWQREPLLPGRSGSIRVTFVPARLPERFDYKIMVYSNAAEKRTELRLKGNLVDNPEKPALLYHYTIDGMKFKKSNVNFGKVYTWETVKDTVRYLNTRQDAVTVGIAKDLPAHLSAEFVPARVEPGEGGMLVLTYDAKAKGDYGYCYESLPLEVNGKRDPRNRLTITATLAEDFSRLDKEELEHSPGVSFASKEADFGTIRRGEKAECRFTLTNSGERPLFIRKVKVTCGCTVATPGKEVLNPGESTDIRVVFDSTGKSGRQSKTVTVITNDPRQTETPLRIEGNVAP